MELNDVNVNSVLDEIRPYIEMDGGYLEYIAIDYVKDGAIVINQAKRYDGFDPSAEFYPVSCATNMDLYNALVKEKPVIHKLGE